MLGAVGWVIARDGFTPDALVYARQTNLLVSTGGDLVQLAKLLS
jgi:hypothetical protein